MTFLTASPCLNKLVASSCGRIVRTYLSFGYWLLGGLGELLDGLLIVSEILFASNENDWETLTKVKDLRNPLLK
jgi:hypothetical protein